MKFTQPFEITKWDQSVADDSDDLELGRATVAKTFADGDLEGVSTAELLMVGTEAGPAAYTAVEKFVGRLAGREGAFVMVHGASADESSSLGKVVAATGDLTGLTGSVVYEHDEQGPRLTLDYNLP
ncbi:uncharacterized protein DUF3224 [Kribbella amoyensis]|uniref:Uncharacterized protein DUF3224 n=1 Tax=Kribbella amoyensis TaxID=996641 RepID=A0A561B3C5_9ACTN|nr:DUF3224 domain-containing protein [Kribbella amoyensis]TWD73378.1 uncharacterized protein DUF3224 [Kribbella amoyensis]